MVVGHSNKQSGTAAAAAALPQVAPEREASNPTSSIFTPNDIQLRSDAFEV